MFYNYIQYIPCRTTVEGESSLPTCIHVELLLADAGGHGETRKRRSLTSQARTFLGLEYIDVETCQIFLSRAAAHPERVIASVYIPLAVHEIT